MIYLSEEYLRALIVKEPWVTYILKGLKKWEIRKRNTKIRGVIGLVCKGTLRGFVELVDSIPMAVSELKDFQQYHLVKYEDLEKYAENRRVLYVWVLENPIKLNKPIEISLPRGAQLWVRIPKRVLLEQLEEDLLRKLFPSTASDGEEE